MDSNNGAVLLQDSGQRWQWAAAPLLSPLCQSIGCNWRRGQLWGWLGVTRAVVVRLSCGADTRPSSWRRLQKRRRTQHWLSAPPGTGAADQVGNLQRRHRGQRNRALRGKLQGARSRHPLSPGAPLNGALHVTLPAACSRRLLTFGSWRSRALCRTRSNRRLLHPGRLPSRAWHGVLHAARSRQPCSEVASCRRLCRPVPVPVSSLVAGTRLWPAAASHSHHTRALQPDLYMSRPAPRLDQHCSVLLLSWCSLVQVGGGQQRGRHVLRPLL